ncbi:MAG: PAAR domain-containing protein [Halopseudomonas sp.]|uniref:PAAR domain-containing protein n=1 Tax=Halopseudomonas sp. TaxID=2901191 RepID=UPI0030016A75
MSGKPAARLGDPTQCPKTGHGGNAIATGSSDVLINGKPAARQGDTTACGSSLVAQVIPNVLINGRPAVVMGSAGSHGDVVIGGSGDVIIGGTAVSFAAESSGAGAPASFAPPGTPAEQNLRSDQASMPLEREEEEEEEETELPVKQQITLRLGMFFDGTGNNMANAAFTEQCRRQDLAQLGEEQLRDIQRFCESMEYVDSDGDGIYDVLPAGSYGNEASNVAVLRDLYMDQREHALPPGSREGSLAIYMDGSGTISGSGDSTWGLATGSGKTGVLAAVERVPELVELGLRLFIQQNRNLEITRIEFDVFGFSRGAAAARHFVNEVLKQDGGVLASLFNPELAILKQGFKWQQHACVNFVGLFDTVAAIANPDRGDWDAGDSSNPGVNLFLPPGCAKQVVQLTAINERRYNFSLNRVHESHLEIPLPGVHSNIGGGYPLRYRERVLLTRPAWVPALSARTSAVWQQLERHRDELVRSGLPGNGRFIIDQSSPDSSGRLCQLALGLERVVKGELSRVALRVMIAQAEQHGLPLQESRLRDERLFIPHELRPISDRIIAAASQGRETSLSDDEWRFLTAHYIHQSAHWNTSPGIVPHKPREGGRAIYPDFPQSGYPE